MKPLDIFPNKAMFCTEDILSFKVVLAGYSGPKTVTTKMYKLWSLVSETETTIVFKDGNAIINFPPVTTLGSYHIVLSMDYLQTVTAFEIENDWKKRPRYGFLSDFTDDEINRHDYIDTFLKLHINVVQYYDWMYQHNDLIAPTDKFTDLMGRELNQRVVKERILMCQKYGIKNIAYGAIYGASNAFYDNHKEWAFYNTKKEPIRFIDVFTIMNFTKESPWRNHLIGEYEKAIEIMNFDGIHMDTYGYPKKALNYQGKVIHLDNHFNELINDTKAHLKDRGLSSDLIFNNVGAWPVQETYKADQSALYIEVWNPMSTYNHLVTLVREVKNLTKQRELIISAYLKPYFSKNSSTAVNAHKLLAAVLYAAGAFHLIMGEDKKTLRTGYYCDYGSLNDNEFNEIRNYYDFNTMYSEVLYDNTMNDVSLTHLDGDNTEYAFTECDVSPTPEIGKVFTIIKENDERKIIHLINLVDSDTLEWNEPQNSREAVKLIKVEVLSLITVSSIYLTSPDKNLLPIEVEFNSVETERGNLITFKIENLMFWDMIIIN